MWHDRKRNRAERHANTVRWEKLDAATDELLEEVADRIDSESRGDLDALPEAEWMKKTELGKIILTIV